MQMGATGMAVVVTVKMGIHVHEETLGTFLG